MATKPSSPSAVSHAQFTDLLALYPTALASAYDAKISDGKKRAQALEDDEWRYVELPRLLGEGKGKEGHLEKAELERLVRWKITHGQNRPFLPSQVRKNEPSLVASATAAGFAAYAPHSGFPKEALKHLTTLHGVGPATATLLLSVFDAENAPFFQDELYAWLVGPEKLKYTLKEYEALWEAVAALRERFGKGKIKAVEVEKVGFAVGHWEELRKEGLVGKLGDEGGVRVGQEDEKVGGRGMKTDDPAADVVESAVQEIAGTDGVDVVASGPLPPAAKDGKRKGEGEGTSKRKRGESTPAAPGSGVRKSSRNK